MLYPYAAEIDVILSDAHESFWGAVDMFQRALTPLSVYNIFRVDQCDSRNFILQAPIPKIFSQSTID